MAYRTLIHKLDNDSLLQIFGCYRLEEGDDWYFLLTWRKLAHVCQRWRFLVYDSWFHLDLCVLLTTHSPSIYPPSHLPPLPLVIYHSDGTRTTARKDEDNVHLGLRQYHGRVRRVFLQAPSSSLRMWLEPMNKLFSTMVDLSLLSTTTEETSLRLPETFQAPSLRRLSLHGIGLPTGLSLLSFAIALSTLSLTCIGASCYFTPGHLVTQLRELPHLEELLVGFAIPIPLPSNERKLLPAPIPPVRLPALRLLTFRGADVYLDNLIAQINTPLLERLSLTLLFGLTFALANLNEHIHGTEGFGCPVAWVKFNKDGASIDAGQYEQQGIGPIGKLNLRVNCEPLDWQIDSITQVCSALGEVLSTVEELTLDLDVDGVPLDWESALDSILWHELLLSFIGVKKLNISSSLTRGLSQALQSVDKGLVMELLPDLQELWVHPEIDHATYSFSLFVKSRESVGCPVHLLVLPAGLPPPPEIRSTQIQRCIFTHRSGLAKGHVFQAPAGDVPVDNEA